MKTVIHTSLKDIQQTAGMVYKSLKGGEVLALNGSLGSGKTTFTQYLAKKLRIKHPVTSPTFVLMNIFKGRLLSKKAVTLYHLDLYRTKNYREIKALGITEVWGSQNTLTIIEWADKIKTHLPKNAICIKFQN